MTTAIFVIYIAAIMGITIYAWRATKNISDYMLGGRSLSPLVASGSTVASGMSGWLLLAFPAVAFAHTQEAAFIAMGLVGGHFCAATFIAPRLRRYSEMLGDAQTLPQFLCARCGRTDRSGIALRLTCCAILLIFMLIYVASGLIAGGKLFSSLLDIQPATGVALSAGIICIYTLFGGFFAISWTDMLQGSLMLVALILLPVAIFSQSPGHIEFSLLAEGETLGNIGWITLLSSLAWGLGYFGMPHVVARYKAIKDPKRLPQFRALVILWASLVLIAAISVGIFGRPWFAADSGEALTIQLIQQFFNPWLAGLALAAIMAAVMSTADSQLLIASNSIGDDLLPAFFPKIAPPQRLIIGRLGVLVITLSAITIALNGDTVLALVAYAWAGLGAAFGPVLLFSLFWDKFSYPAAIAGILTGGISAVVLHHFPLLGLYELLPAFALSLLAIWITGRLSTDAIAAQQFEQLQQSNPAQHIPHKTP